MKFYIGAVVLASVLLLPMVSLAVEPELIPGGFPAAQKPAFSKERAALVAEKKALDHKVSRYNAQCSKPQPYLVHKCGDDRLALFQQVDAYKKKVEDFNKRLAAIDKGLDPKQADKSRAEDGHE